MTNVGAFRLFVCSFTSNQIQVRIVAIDLIKKIVQIGAILAIFRPFEVFRFLAASTGIGVNMYTIIIELLH